MVIKQKLKGVSPLFSITAISEHLKRLNYPENSIKSMLRCGTPTGFKLIAECGCGVRLVDLSYRCNQRTCPVCSLKRKRRVRRKYLPYLRTLKIDSMNNLYFLTISPKNYKSLSYGLKHIRESFKKFRRNKYFKERVKAGLWVLETTKKDKGWNIHIHCLFYGRRLDNRIRGRCRRCGQNLLKFDYVNKKFYCANRNCNSTDVIVKQDSKLVSIWNSCSGRPVNINIPSQNSSRNKYSVSSSLNYMLKYIGSNKDDFYDPKDVANYIFQTRKQKLLNVFGFFFNYKPGESPFICPICRKEVRFTFDIEVVHLIQSFKPPPVSLSNFRE